MPDLNICKTYKFPGPCQPIWCLVPDPQTCFFSQRYGPVTFFCNHPDREKFLTKSCRNADESKMRKYLAQC